VQAAGSEIANALEQRQDTILRIPPQH
jgi:hypothetical protein